MDFPLPRLPAGKFFEVRTLFPPELLTTAVSGTKSLASILAEEQAIVDRTKAEQAFSRQTKEYVLARGLAAALPLLGLGLIHLVLIILLWWRHGREYPLPEGSLSGYLHDPPTSTPPAVVVHLLDLPFTDLKPAFVSTLLDLIRRKIVKLVEVDRQPLFYDWLIGVTGRDRTRQFGLQLLEPKYLIDKRLTDFEIHLLNIFFVRIAKKGPNTYGFPEEDPDSVDLATLSATQKVYFDRLADRSQTVTFSQFKDYAAGNMGLGSAFRKWTRQIMSAGSQMDLIDSESNKLYWSMNPHWLTLQKLDWNRQELLRFLFSLAFIGLFVASFILPVYTLNLPPLTMFGALLLLYTGLAISHLLTLRHDTSKHLFVSIRQNSAFLFLTSAGLFVLGTATSHPAVFALAALTLVIYFLYRLSVPQALKSLGRRTAKGAAEAAKRLAFQKHLQN